MRFMGADAACILASDRYLRMRHGEGGEGGVAPPPPPRLSVCFGVPTQTTACQILTYGAIFSSSSPTESSLRVVPPNPNSRTVRSPPIPRRTVGRRRRWCTDGVTGVNRGMWRLRGLWWRWGGVFWVGGGSWGLRGVYDGRGGFWGL